jgi:hypothetical protein
MFKVRVFHYVLQGKTPVAIDPGDPAGHLRWAKWFNTADRHVAKETICGKRVSTVFLGIDHGFDPDGPPILFETMVFAELPEDEKNKTIEMPDGTLHTYRYEIGEIDGYTRRYSTWEEAAYGHRETVEMIRRMMIKIVNGNA